ncbi:unnamed protein product [Aureobasidium pullulans]|nr:unnamed protein product [Aureobasidium pullulans]
MKQAAIFGSVLGFAALVAAGPILRSGAINALQSSEKGLNKENNFDDLLEDFVATLNYPADMMKKSVGLEDNFSRGEFLEAVTLKNGDAFEAYIDHMDDDAVRKALVSAEMYTDFYNGPKGAFDNKNDSGIAKRDFSDWCHNKCKFKAAFHSNSDKYYCGCFDDCTCKTKAAWHRDMEAYYCKCMNKCEKNDDLIPDCCKENTESCNDDESATLSDSSRDPSILLPTPPMPPIPSTLPMPLPTSKSPVPSTPPMPLPKSTSPADINASSGSFQKCNFKCNFKVFFKSNYTRDECMSNCLGFAYTTPTPPPGSSGKSVRRCDFKCDFKVFFKSNYSYDTCMSDCLGYAFTTPQAPKVTADDTVVTDEANDNFLDKLYGGGKDKDLTRRSSAGNASAIQKCRTKAAWHWHSKKHYDDCMHECNMKHSQGA